MTNKTKHIPSIHNYCDRWCERCPFTGQCAAYTPPNSLEKDKKTHITTDENAFLEEVLIDFEAIMDLLRQEAESMGMDWDALIKEAKEVKIDTPIHQPEHINIKESAKKYTLITTKWLNENFSKIIEYTNQVCLKMDLGIPNASAKAFVVGNSLEVIQWHISIIEAKISRAIRNLNNGDYEAFDTQSDANGSAKVAIRSIDKSIEAWEVIRIAIPDCSDELLDQLATLAKIKRKLMKIFPQYDQFIRPGFDTEKRQTLVEV